MTTRRSATTARALTAALDQCGGRSALTALSLSGCGLTTAGALALVRAAVRIPTLRTLAMYGIINVTSAVKAVLDAECGANPRLCLTL